MNTSQAVWSEWVTRLRSRGYARFAASLLDAFKPVSIIAAQFIYLGTPLLSPIISKTTLIAAAELLENEHHVLDFANELKAGGSS
jgi:hypothetical protein